jgi:HlyD family secretion protein
MQAPRDIQAQLRTLSIASDQRPADGGGALRKLLGGAVFILVAAIAFAGYRSREKIAAFVQDMGAPAAKAAPIETITVRLTEPPAAGPVLTATGKIVSDHIVSVATKVSGQIVELRFEQGDSVKEGQMLALIEDVKYKARRDEAAAILTRSQASLEFAKTNFERVRKLVGLESAPSIEYADARRTLDEAQAQVRAAQAGLDWAEKTLIDTKVLAPISGVILERNVEVGDFVAAEGGLGANANARFAVIADMEKLRVEVDVSELDIARLRDQMPCVIVPDAYKDRKYGGHIMWIDPGANYSKATVQVKVRIDQPDEFLRVEGSAQVTFMPEAANDPHEQQASIWVPRSAIVERDGAMSVYTVVDGRFRRQTITPGRTSADRVEVLAGLAAGQIIAAGGAESISDGQRAGS